jgi:ABC-type bacteriocin/lantibiotic exporter with double-glycine peptidase domain
MKDYKNFLLEKITPKVKLDFPEFRQIYNYDCGVTALQQVLVYYGIEKREDELINMLDTKKEDGTKLSKMINVSKYFGLEAEIIKNSSIKEIKKLIDNGIPPILSLQAWKNFSNKNYNWKNDYDDGHYAVAIGYNDNTIFFEDPSSVVRTYLTFDELEDRWHDLDDNNKTKNYHTILVIKGEKKYNSKDIVHMN